MQAAVKGLGKTLGRKGKALFHPIRLAVTGSMSGPDMGAQVRSCSMRPGAPPLQVRSLIHPQWQQGRPARDGGRGARWEQWWESKPLSRSGLPPMLPLALLAAHRPPRSACPACVPAQLRLLASAEGHYAAAVSVAEAGDGYAVGAGQLVLSPFPVAFSLDPASDSALGGAFKIEVGCAVRSGPPPAHGPRVYFYFSSNRQQNLEERKKRHCRDTAPAAMAH